MRGMLCLCVMYWTLTGQVRNGRHPKSQEMLMTEKNQKNSTNVQNDSTEAAAVTLHI